MGRLARTRKIRADDVHNPRGRSKVARPDLKKKGGLRDQPPAPGGQRFKGQKARFHDMIRLGREEKINKKTGKRVGAPAKRKVMAVPEPRRRKEQPASDQEGSDSDGNDPKAPRKRDLSKLRFKTKRMPNESFHAYSRRLDAEARGIANRESKRPKVVSDKRKRHLQKREDREKQRKRRRRNGGASDDEEGDGPRFDRVEFGEVAMAPPTFTMRPKSKRAPNAAVMAAAAAAHAAEEAGSGGGGGGGGGGGDDDDDGEAESDAARGQRMRERHLELRRQRAVLSYKNAKKARKTAAAAARAAADGEGGPRPAGGVWQE